MATGPVKFASPEINRQHRHLGSKNVARFPASFLQLVVKR